MGFSQKEIDIFTQLFYADQLRGSDGAGIFYNSKRGMPTLRTLRGAYGSAYLVPTKEYDAVSQILFKESNFVVGHNRAATRGGVKLASTHPFTEKHITLVHNGTLTNQKDLDNSVEVDSHAICTSFANIGVKETLTKTSGAYALVWFDSKEKTLNLCRNSQRPLHLIELNSCYIISSELKLAEWIADRNNVFIAKSFLLEAGKHYQFSIEDMSVYTEEQIITYTPVIYQAPPHKPADVFSFGSSNSPTKNFAFGQKIKFRSGLVRQDGQNGTFLEGDVLKYQTMHPSNILATDYEDEYRVRIYGNASDLEELKNNDFLEGTVDRTYIKLGLATYILTKVHSYCAFKKILNDSSRNKPKPIPKHIQKDEDCEWCGIGKATHHLQNYKVCDVCANENIYTC